MTGKKGKLVKAGTMMAGGRKRQIWRSLRGSKFFRHRGSRIYVK